MRAPERADRSQESFPFFNGDNMHGTIDNSFSTGSTGAGVLDNRVARGFAALSYVVSPPPDNFYLETWIRVTATTAEKGC